MFGAQQQFVKLPEFLKGRFEIAGVGVGAYRLFIIYCVMIAVLMVRPQGLFARPAGR